MRKILAIISALIIGAVGITTAITSSAAPAHAAVNSCPGYYICTAGGGSNGVALLVAK